MVDAENDALPNAKVGGIGDVVRDIPLALAEQGCNVQVVLPDYGHFAVMPNAEKVGQYQLRFAGQIERVELYRLQSQNYRHERVTYWAINHVRFSPCGDGRVYCNDDDNRPFATDASKYAFFCAAVGSVSCITLARLRSRYPPSRQRQGESQRRGCALRCRT